MMRYQSMSQDCLSLSNGRRPNLKLAKEEDRHNTTIISQSYENSSKAPIFAAFENRAARIRPGPNPSVAQDRAFPPPPPPSPPPSPPPHDASGDVLLQWGNKKRSRGPRAEARAAADDSPHLGRRPVKVPRRVSLPQPANGKGGLSLRSSTAVRDSATTLRRALASILLRTSIYSDRSREKMEMDDNTGKITSRTHPRRAKGSVQSNAILRGVDERSNGKRSPEKMNRTVTRAANGSTEAANPHLACDAGAAVCTAAEKAELPKIQLTLSRKEKEEDFLLMKFSKLPQRPKKRPKAVEKALQYVYPGMWLSDLSRGRYEVREKKCAKKKKKGLKGMESMDSDSY